MNIYISLLTIIKVLTCDFAYKISHNHTHQYRWIKMCNIVTGGVTLGGAEVHVRLGDVPYSYLDTPVVSQLYHCTSFIFPTYDNVIVYIERQCQPGTSGRYVYLYIVGRLAHSNIYNIQMYGGKKVKTECVIPILIETKQSHCGILSEDPEYSKVFFKWSISHWVNIYSHASIHLIATYTLRHHAILKYT